MKALNPYLNFPGTTEEAFNFYKSVFGGEFVGLQRFKDTPEAGNVPDAVKDKIMHIALPLDSGNVLMATDAMEEMGHKVTSGTNFHITISTDSEAETDKIFNALSAGGKVTQPLAKMFWGDYFGMLTDKFGIQWMVSYSESRQN